MFLQQYGYAKAVKNNRELSEYILSNEKQERDRSFYIENSVQIIYDTMIDAVQNKK